nr:hypothetical protein [Lachnospiraceae bacterium]
MKTQEWSLWRILCLSGLPWYGIFVGLGLYLQRQYDLGLSTKMIVGYSVILWIIVLCKNLTHASGGKSVGLFTWLTKYSYEPPEESSRKY